MKIFIAIAILLNAYGALASPHLFSVHKDVGNLYHHSHHKHHIRGNSVHELTVDDLADVLLSLPGALGKSAYRTFLSLGEFLPADTKAHNFFLAIPKAIRRKARNQMPEMRTIPQQVQGATNPIFMMQPAGFNVVPLPMHPMFSSSPLDYLTRVPCRHTKVIRVPMHTFDVQISATTHSFKPTKNIFDEFNSSDSDSDDDDNGLKDLLEMIESLGEDDDDEDKPPRSKNDEQSSDEKVNAEEEEEDKSKDNLPKEDDKTEDSAENVNADGEENSENKEPEQANNNPKDEPAIENNTDDNMPKDAVTSADFKELAPTTEDLPQEASNEEPPSQNLAQEGSNEDPTSQNLPQEASNDELSLATSASDGEAIPPPPASESQSSSVLSQEEAEIVKDEVKSQETEAGESDKNGPETKANKKNKNKKKGTKKGKNEIEQVPESSEVPTPEKDAEEQPTPIPPKTLRRRRSKLR